ncbi:MAG: chloride channel protein [Bacteroidales bacterium]|nr:chloride channel protein [Bacteroidales bacterium]
MKFNLIKRLIDSQKQIKERIGVPNTVLLLSFFTGVLGATVAIILKNLLHFTSGILYKAFPEAQMNYLYLAFPLVGILLTLVFVKKVVKDDLSHGVSIALRKMFSSGGKLRVHHTYSSMIASSLTVGFGGSVGLEAPIVLTGSAVGSNLARLFELSPKNTRLLLACGATAALSTIFKAPIAGIVFAIEVLMLDFTATALLPLLISAATGTVLSILFLGADVMISLPHVSSFHLQNIPYYLILGVLAGFVSVYFMRTMRSVEKTIKKISNIWVRAVLGGILLGGFIFLFPVFYGEGYEYINALVNGSSGMQLFERSPLYGFMNHYLFFIIVFIFLILFKVIASAITTASGGVGGVFAPSLFAGAFLGFFLSEICNHFIPVSLPTVNFVLAGMSGVMTGVMFAPLTGIFLIAEMTTGYELLIPLMITSSISYIVAGRFEKHSVYTYPLADEGCLKTHNKDQFAIQALDWKPLMDKNIQTISIHATLRDYTQCIAHSKRNLFVVLDDDHLFAGLLVMDDHRDIIFKTELYDTVKIEELMIHPELFIYDTDSGEEVIRKFNKTQNFNMPVITINREYLGFLSKAKVLDEYRDTIVEESDN